MAEDLGVSASTGHKIVEHIVIPDKPRSRRRVFPRSGSSSSSPNVPKTDTFISNGKLIDRSTGKSVNLSTYGGNLNKALSGLKIKTTGATWGGTIKGTYYSNLTKQELEQNKLSSGSVAKQDVSRTRLIQGRGTSADSFNVLAKGKRSISVEDIRRAFESRLDDGGVTFIKSSREAQRRALGGLTRTELRRYFQIAKPSLTKQQQSFYKSLPIKERLTYLSNIVNRRVQPTQSNIAGANFIKTLSTSDRKQFLTQKRGAGVQIIRDPVTEKAHLVNFSNDVTRSDAERFVKRLNLDNRARFYREIFEFQRNADIRKTNPIEFLVYFYNKGYAEARKLLRKPSLSTSDKRVIKYVGIGAIGFGSGAIGSVQAITKPIKTFKDTLKLFTNPKKTFSALKSSFKANPVYSVTNLIGAIVVTNALFGAGSKVIRLSSSKLGDFMLSNSKLVKNLPKLTKVRVGTILRTTKGAFGIVVRGGRVLKIPTTLTIRSLNVIKKALLTLYDPITEISRSILSTLRVGKNLIGTTFFKFVKRNSILIKKIPIKTKLFPKGTILKDLNGNFGIVLKDGIVNVFKSKVTQKLLDAMDDLFPELLGTAHGGETINIKLMGGKDIKLRVAEGMPKLSTQKQLKLVGKKPISISSQGNELVNLFTKNKAIRKPLSNEGSLSKATKKLLDRFDRGNLKTNKEFLLLDQSIRKEVGMGLIERSFFADPSGIIRPSRLGTIKQNPLTASFGESLTLKDILTGNFTFKRAKPQILLFTDVIVEGPKNLKSIINKIKRGKSIDASETAKLIEWQSTKSGKFKALGKISKDGFLTGEAEVTLAPKEILVKGKTLGYVDSYGNKIPIVRVSVYQPKGKIKDLLGKFDDGVITKKELLKLKRNLDKLTGFKNKFLTKDIKKQKYLSSPKTGKKYVSLFSLSSKGVRGLSRVKGSSIKKASSLKRVSSPKKASSPKRGSSPKRVSSPKRGSSPKRTNAPKHSPKRRQEESWDSKLKKGEIRIVNALIRVRGKTREIKLRTTPNRALKFITSKVDHTTTRSFQLKIVGTTKGTDIKKLSLKKFRIKKSKGSKVLCFVEKTKFAIDTRGEKKGLKIGRLLRKKRPKKLKIKR